MQKNGEGFPLAGDREVLLALDRGWVEPAFQNPGNGRAGGAGDCRAAGDSSFAAAALLLTLSYKNELHL